MGRLLQPKQNPRSQSLKGIKLNNLLSLSRVYVITFTLMNKNIYPLSLSILVFFALHLKTKRHCFLASGTSTNIY